MLSAYLPPDFDPRRPLALIAGRGRYPVITAEAIRRAGVPVRLIAMDDETSPDLVASFPEAERVSLNVGQVGKMLDALKSFGAGYALMAGQVKPKKLFHGLVPDLKAASILSPSNGAMPGPSSERSPRKLKSSASLCSTPGRLLTTSWPRPGR